MRIILIRHAESVGNEAGLMISTHEGGLTDIGRTQSKRLAGQLGHAGVQQLYSSPSHRGIATAEILNSFLAVPSHVSDTLMERELGLFDGMDIEKLTKIRTKERHSFLDVTQDWHGVVGVEQDEEVFKRFGLFVSEASSTSVDVVAAVTHAGFIKSVVSVLLSVHPKRRCILKIPNCSATILDRNSDVWMLRQFSFTGVIGGAAR